MDIELVNTWSNVTSDGEFLNILVITREIPPVGGGAGHVALNLAEKLALLGHRIYIVTMHFDDLPEYEERGLITIYRVRCGRKNQDSSYLLEMLRFVISSRSLAQKVAREHNCQVVHAHAIIPDGLIALHAAKGFGLPTVITSHGSDVPGHNINSLSFKIVHKLLSPLWYYTLEQARALVVPSDYFATLIRKLRPNQSVVVIPNGINLDTFSDSERKKSGSFLICSRLIKSKNFHLFLIALKQVSNSQTVHIVGQGPMLNELKELAGDLPQHRVVFHGWLENRSEEWRNLYEECRYFVAPSERETFGISVLEAQLAGMVVLASSIPPHREVLANNAVYFEELTVDGIANTIKSLISGDLKGLDQIVKKGEKRVKENFSWSKVAEQYLDLYKTVLNS